MNKFKIPNMDEEKSVLKTIRLKLTILKKVEDLAAKNNLSVNRLINECIEFAINNMEDDKKTD